MAKLREGPGKVSHPHSRPPGVLDEAGGAELIGCDPTTSFEDVEAKENV